VTTGGDQALFKTIFRNFTFQHYCGEVFRHFNSRYPELRNGFRSTIRYFVVLYFNDSTFWYSCGEVFRHFNSRYLELRNRVRSTVRYFIVLYFDDSAFRHSCGEVFRHFNSWYPELRNGFISQSAKLFVGVPISGFRHFAFHDFRTPVLKSLDS
jgi:hypothetical protein